MTGAGHGPDSEVVDAARVEQARASSGPHNGRRAWRWLRGVLLVVGAALVLGSAVAVLARLTGWEGGPLAYGVALLPWLTAGAALAVLLGVVMRSRALVAAALAVSAAGGWWLLPLYSSAGHIPSGSPALTVATGVPSSCVMTVGSMNSSVTPFSYEASMAAIGLAARVPSPLVIAL